MARPGPFALVIALAVAGLADPGFSLAGQSVPDLKADDLFQPTKIWTLHFTLAAAEWEKMQPTPYPPDDTTPRRNGVGNNLVLNEVHADLEFEGRTFRDIGLRAKGNGTLINSVAPKLPLKVDFNQNVKGQKLAGLTTLNLHNNIWDPTSMNELLAYRLFRAVGVAAPRVTHARVYLTVPGKYDRRYIGLYSVVENIDKNFTADRFGSRDAAIFKPSEPNFFTYHGPDWTDYQRIWDPKDEPTDPQKQRVIDFVSFINFSSDATFAARLEDFFDVPNLARQLATTAWIANLDGPPAGGQNLYVVLDPRTDRFITLPWDEDDAFGGISQTQDVRNTLNIFKPWATTHAFFSRVFELESFRKPYFETLARIALDYGRSENLIQEQLALVPILRPAVKDESETALGLFEGAIADTNVPRTFAGTFGAHGSHLTLREFTRAREKSVIDQLLRGN